LAEKSHARETSFDADENARRQVAFLADRLGARFGAHRMQRFAAQDTHIPEMQAVAIPAQERDFDAPWTRKRRDRDPPLRPWRMLERPEEIHFVAAEVPDGPPARFHWRQCRHDVVRAEGPERIALEWWKDARLTRDYFRVETKSGQRFWLYRDGLFRELGLATRWYLQGIFA
jgi:protein ImuB